MHCIIAEDDVTLAHMLAAKMRHKGFEVLLAANAKEAAAHFWAHDDVKLVLSDFGMGGGDLDGDALFLSIKDELFKRGVPFVIISAIIPTAMIATFNEMGVPVLEKWRLSRDFDKVVAPLIPRS